MFLGTFQTKFSGNKRIVLPKKFRNELENETQVVLTRGLDGCIWGFKKEVWERQALEQIEIPLTEERGRFLRRYIFSAAEVVDLDKQGRFIIPEFLTEFAGVVGDVVLIGAGDHFEIWNPDNWNDFMGVASKA